MFFLLCLIVFQFSNIIRHILKYNQTMTILKFLITIPMILIVVLNQCSSDIQLSPSSTCQFNIQNSNQMLYFIRHAESQYNAAEKKMEKKLGPDYQSSQEYLDQKFSSKYFDVQITQHGEQQSLVARQRVANIDVDLILVSPLRRALHTCSIIFQNHKSKAPIIVSPVFRQIMQSSNDLGTEIEESMLRYPTFDFSLIKDKQAWYVDTLSDEADRKGIIQKLQGLQGKEKSAKCIEECLQVMKQNWSDRRAHPEKQQTLKKRILPDATQQKEVIQHYLKTYSKIAIVAHSECIKHYAGYKIANCEVYPYQASKL